MTFSSLRIGFLSQTDWHWTRLYHYVLYNRDKRFIQSYVTSQYTFLSLVLTLRTVILPDEHTQLQSIHEHNRSGNWMFLRDTANIYWIMVPYRKWSESWILNLPFPYPFCWYSIPCLLSPRATAALLFQLQFYHWITKGTRLLRKCKFTILYRQKKKDLTIYHFWMGC